MDEAFMQWLAMLRVRCAFPLEVVSAYRCNEHPREKEKPSPHSKGLAVDIKVQGKRAWKLVREAFELNFIGVGIYQGRDREEKYIHLDMDVDRTSPEVWSG